MKSKLKKMLSINFAALTFIMSIFLIFSCNDKPLVAANKKQKNHEKKQKIRHAMIKQRYENLKEDYHLTLDNFVVLLQRLVTVYDELDARILELEGRIKKHEEELFIAKEILNKKALEDESFRIGFDVPFLENPLYINGVRVERHPLGDGSS